MSGSTIFQFTESRIGSLCDPRLMSDWELNDGFVPAVADYIYYECDRKESFESLLRSLTRDYTDLKQNGGDYSIEHKFIKRVYLTARYSDTPDKEELPEAYIIFHEGFKEYYFTGMFNSVQKTIRDMDLDKFMDGLFAFTLQNMIDDEYGYYIFNEGRGYESLDSWIRDNLKNDAEYKFWLGSTLNYHL